MKQHLQTETRSFAVAVEMLHVCPYYTRLSFPSHA